ncbi:hypothetical protein THSYN_14855 [Candidatus Thiodictyon syntrophicum]|uniref:VWFA domain-containing protein n=1 Tax=Candidatus Thiodictyon syntrophicum TaxID=1166950 RepID=A0A2K8UAK9_9GAMM|nr:hypothetical protein THSYN_14855 [Candidatus Thiodictyon syntrophicum]
MPVAIAGAVGLLLWSSLAGAAPSPGPDDYQSILVSMQGRQTGLESELGQPRHCLGERLDGLLEINHNCPPEARALAEDENRNRTALHGLMGRDLNLAPDEIGRQRAVRYVERYRPGVLREVRLSEDETTWWDGRPPDPRKTPVARVLALQGARIHERADPLSAVTRDNVQQYESFGVVDSTKDGQGRLWYQITEDHVPKVKPPDWSPKGLGWIAQDECIPWRRAVVMRFTNPLQREQSLLFAKPEPLLALMDLDPAQRRNRVADLSAAVERRTGGGDVIAVEPRVNPNQDRAVMYPVLDFYGRGRNADLRIDGKTARVLEVAARTGTDGAAGGTVAPVDILFVMDTTESMGPYLREVLAAVEAFAVSSPDDSLRFGFVGYRDLDPRFEYQAREFTSAMQSARDFVRTLKGIRAQPVAVSGDDIPESVFEGLQLAIKSEQWRPEALKLLFLVGDAPGKDTLYTIEALRRKADVARVKLVAFPIKNSKISKGLDQVTERQYRELASAYQGSFGTSGETSYVYAVDAESKGFKQLVLDRLHEGETAIAQARRCAAGGQGSECLQSVQSGTLSELIFQHAALTLAGPNMPRNEVRGWVSDKVLTNPGQEALAPMVLFTEAELDELEARVRELKDVGEIALRGESGTTLDFFDLVARNTRITMVDPTAVNFRDAFAIPLGIDQLPYDSDIMSMTRDEFQNPDRVQGFVASLKTKLATYEDLRRARGDPQVWRRLSTGAKERVVGVELNHLP